MDSLRALRSQCRTIRQSSREYVHQRPPLRWTLSALYWLPLGLFVTEYAFNIKSVKGRSMQVASYTLLCSAEAGELTAVVASLR